MTTTWHTGYDGVEYPIEVPDIAPKPLTDFSVSRYDDYGVLTTTFSAVNKEAAIELAKRYDCSLGYVMQGYKVI